MANPRPFYEILKQNKAYSLGWLNEERTIFLVQVFGPWDFEDALENIAYASDVIQSVQKPVYIIFEYVTDYITIIPTGVTIFNMRQLIEYDPPNGQLVIFIRQDSLTHTFLNILHSVALLRNITNKHRFVNTWDEAMAQIDQHQASISAQA